MHLPSVLIVKGAFGEMYEPAWARALRDLALRRLRQAGGVDRRLRQASGVDRRHAGALRVRREVSAPYVHAVGDVVAGADSYGDFIGRIERVGGGGLTEIRLDADSDGHERVAFVHSKAPLVLVEKYSGPSEAVIRLSRDGFLLNLRISGGAR